MLTRYVQSLALYKTRLKGWKCGEGDCVIPIFSVGKAYTEHQSLVPRGNITCWQSEVAKSKLCKWNVVSTSWEQDNGHILNSRFQKGNDYILGRHNIKHNKIFGGLNLFFVQKQKHFCLSSLWYSGTLKYFNYFIQKFTRKDLRYRIFYWI